VRKAADAELPDKVAMVTAASEGLGYACALRLAEAGCRVAICGRRANVLDAARAEIERRAQGEVCAVPADLTRPDQIEGFVRRATERFQRVDILVVNTGHIPYGGLDDLREEEWYAAFELILMSAVRLCRLVTPLMRGHGGWGYRLHHLGSRERIGAPAPALERHAGRRGCLSEIAVA
jgi:3-oxoacyl-[acyl-carrier protein] reductase